MHKDVLRFTQLCREMENLCEALQLTKGCIDCRKTFSRRLDELKVEIDKIIEENKGVMV